METYLRSVSQWLTDCRCFHPLLRLRLDELLTFPLFLPILSTACTYHQLDTRQPRAMVRLHQSLLSNTKGSTWLAHRYMKDVVHGPTNLKLAVTYIPCLILCTYKHEVPQAHTMNSILLYLLLHVFIQHMPSFPSRLRAQRLSRLSGVIKDL